jgi:hypothetical protein
MLVSFWSNTIWYLLLFCTSIISIIFILIKSKNRGLTIAFTFATLGFIYLLEAILIISFGAYRYYPKIVDDVFQDAVLGNVFSQVSISTTSALIITYELSYAWYFLFALIYFMIEEFFIKLGIFEHFWYKAIYTVIGFVPFFWFTKKWYYKLISSSKYFIYYITLFLAVFSVSANTIVMPLKLLGIQIFQVNFFNELSKNHTTTGIIYAFLLINILINVHRWQFHWIWKGIVFLILITIQFFLYHMGVVYIKEGWILFVTLLDIFGVFFWVVIMNNLLENKSSKNIP